MITPAYAQRMAAYNRWMNGKLYAAAAGLSEAQRREDRGAFFKSLHGTLNHLMYADTAWLYRFTGRSIDALDPKRELFADFAAMRAARTALDVEIQFWAEGLTEDWLREPFSYYSQVLGRSLTRPAWLLVTHLFHHQTHHRGQATTLLTQFGADVGVTDLPGMPDLVEG
jgi:uncharacterized damage-inducible protein DinB